MTHKINKAALDDFLKNFAGTVILPVDAGYDETRSIFNAMIDKHPAVIAQCSETEDVVRAIRFGREEGLEIAVRGAGTAWQAKA